MKRRGRPEAVPIHAELLRARRQELGLSRDDLAMRAGLARSTVQLVETERRGAHATLAKLAAALDLTVADLSAGSATDDAAALAARGLVAPPPPAFLAGRDDELARVRESLSRPGVVCLLGPMGIGKTALASTLAAELAREGPVAWLSESRLAQAFPSYDLQLAVAEALGFAQRLPPPSAPAAAADAVYRDHAARRLRATVLDDVRSERFARHFEAGTVLCTTHSRALAEAIGTVVIQLRPLSAEEARALLARYVAPRRIEGDPEGARALLTRLGGVPRSLHIAGRALRELALVTPGDYAARIDTDPAAHADARELSALRDPDERRNCGQTVGYEDLEASLPASTQAFFRALAPFEDRAFPLGWAAAAAGVTPADAARETSLLRDRFLLVDAHHVSPTEQAEHDEPRFALDDHAAWYCRWRAGDAAVARANLLRHACVRARELARVSEEERRDRYSAERDLWAIVLAPPELGRAWEPPEREAARGDAARGTEPEVALALWRVLATRAGVLEDATVQSAYARAVARCAGEAPGSPCWRAAGQLALVAGMRLSAVARDQSIASSFLLDAADRFAAYDPLAAANAWSGAARLVSASRGPAEALGLMERARRAALEGSAAPIERAIRSLDLAQMRVWADMTSPAWDRIAHELEEAEALAATAPGRRGVAVGAAARIARHLQAWKRGDARIDDARLVDALDALLASISASELTVAAILALRAWALGPRGSASRRAGMSRARACFRRALSRAWARSAWTDYGLAEIVWIVWLFRHVTWNEHTERAILGALDPWVGLAPPPFDPARPEDPPRFGLFLGIAMPVACTAELLSPALLEWTHRYSVEGRGPGDPDTQRLAELVALVTRAAGDDYFGRSSVLSGGARPRLAVER